MEASKIDVQHATKNDDDEAQSASTYKETDEKCTQNIHSCGSQRKLNEKIFPRLHTADMKALKEEHKQKPSLASGNACMLPKSEDGHWHHKCSCSTCNMSVINRTSHISAESDCSGNVAPRTLQSNEDGQCTCFRQPPCFCGKIPKQTEDSGCSNTSSSDLSKDMLCDGYGCNCCKRERIKQWRQMGRALRQLLDRSRHSLSRNTVNTQVEDISRGNRRAFKLADCSSQTNRLLECASPNICRCRSCRSQEIMSSNSLQTEKKSLPHSEVTQGHCEQHPKQMDQNVVQVPYNIELNSLRTGRSPDCIYHPIPENYSLTYSSPSHKTSHICSSHCNASNTESESKSRLACTSRPLNSSAQRKHDNLDPDCDCVRETAYCSCGNKAGTDDTGLGSMLRNTDDSDSAVSDDGVATLFPVSVAGKLIFLPGHAAALHCSCPTKLAKEIAAVGLENHNPSCHISSEENFIVSSEGTWVKTLSTSMPSPESTITDTSSVVDLLEASCDYIPHFSEPKEKTGERKMKSSRRLYKRFFRVPDGEVSSLSSEDTCQQSTKPGKSSCRKADQSRSLKQRAPIVALPNGYTATVCQLSSSEDNLDFVHGPNFPLEVKQENAAEKKSQFSSFLSGLRSAIPYLPQRLRASLHVAQSDSSPDTVDPNSSFSWEHSSSFETEASIVEEEETLQKSSDRAEGESSAINCMSDILTELKEIRRDLDDTCNCVDDTDKLSSSVEADTDFSDECRLHSPSSSDSGEADDEFECECDSCQLLQQQRADHRVVTQTPTQPEQSSVDGATRGSGVLWLPHTDEEEGMFQINVAELSPLESLMSDRRGMLDLMFENVIIQMLAVHPDLLNDQAPPPATDVLVDGLPSLMLTQEHIDQSPSCPVCLCPCSVGEMVTKLPCQHLFHPLCIRAWLVKSGTCPVCRHVLGT